MSQGKEDYSDEKVYDDDLNQMSKNANDGGGFRDDIQAHETITALRPVFLDDTENQWKYCDANDVDRLQFDGFALEQGSADTAMPVQLSGIVRGLSSLDGGKKYYVQDDGTIGTTPGTYKIIVGRAISATELLIIKELPTEIYASDTLRHSNDTEKSTSSNSYAKIKEILCNKKLDSVRIKFYGYRAGAYVTYAKIYKNGSAIGIEQTLGAGATFSEDLGSFATGDLIQIYALSQGGTAYVSNFRIYYDEKIIPSYNFTNQDP